MSFVLQGTDPCVLGLVGVGTVGLPQGHCSGYILVQSRREAQLPSHPLRHRLP